MDPFVTEDQHHPSLDITCILETRTNSKNKLHSCFQNSYNFKKANFQQMYQQISFIDWTFLEAFDNSEDASTYLYGKLYNVFDRCCPKYTVQSKNRYPPWYNGSIIKDLQAKSRLWRKYKRKHVLQAFEDFKQLRAKIKHDVDAAYRKFIGKTEEEIHTNPNRFWTFINNKRGSSKISQVLTLEGKTLEGPFNILNGFANLFKQSYTTSSPFLPNSEADSNHLLNITSFSENEVYDALRSLKPKKTTGPDDIPAFILKDCASVLARPLSILINICLKSASIPRIWKSSKVCPIFKKGDRRDISNYRPISIICNFAKVFEILMERVIYRHVSCCLSVNQHGFMKSRSTVTNLSIITQYIAESIDNRAQTDVIYTDFSKAFDRLDHGILLNKLNASGLSPLLIKLFQSYLRDRKQYVQLNGFKSDEYTASSGVPQGSNLGPLLFNIFINDIAEVLNVNFLLYADDLKLYCQVENIGDSENLSENVSRIVEWCYRNNLPLNPDKCKVVSYSLKTNILKYDYSIENVVLERPETFTDLGVTFDTTLSFNKHIDNVISSSYRMYGLIARSSSDFKETFTLKTLFYAFIRSKLEYASVVWSPYYKYHIDRIEGIQRRFLKLLSLKIDGIYPPIGTPHSELLERHNFYSLERRRDYYSVILSYKIIKGIIDCPTLLGKFNICIPRISSRHPNTFYVNTARTNILEYSPLHTMCKKTNDVGQDLDIFYCKLSDIKSHFLF